MAALDDDTRLEPDGPNQWRGAVTDRWSIVGPNGGYVATLITRALMAASPFPDPLAMTVHFVAPAAPGPVTVEVEVLRTGRAHATLSARLHQENLVAVALSTFGRQRADGSELLTATMPNVPPPEQCLVPTGEPAFVTTFRDRFENRVPPGGDPNFGGAGNGLPVSGGWKRLWDRELDDLAIPLFMDSAPPSIWAATGRGGAAPTVELTVHWRSKPHTRWHLAWFNTPSLRGGYFVENGELWGEDGQLVAESRQLARSIEN